MASILNATTSSGLVTSADNSGSLQLQTNNGTTAVTIDTSQRVLINATSASGFDSGADNLIVGAGSGSNGITIYSGNTSTAAINFADGTTGSDIYAGGIVYNHNTNNLDLATTDGSTRMRITSGGNLFVNCTSEPSSSVKGWGLTQIAAGNYVSSATTNSGNFDHYYFYSVSGLAGFIRTNGTTCTYNSVSDVRLKENIVDAPSALATVNDIKVRSFDWKNSQDHVDYGFIAQELNDVAPQAVAEGINEQDSWAVDTSMLIPMLVKSIQELKAELNEVKAELDATKAEVQALKGVA